MRLPVQEHFEHPSGKLPVSVFRSVMNDRNILLPHWHDCMELILIESGSGTAQVDLVSYNVSAGNVVVISPDSIHSLRAEEGTEMNCRAIVFNLKLFSGLPGDSIYCRYVEPVLSRQITFSPVLKCDPRIQQLIRQIVDSFQKQSYLFDLEMKAGLFSIYYQLFANGCASSREGPSDDVLLKLRKVLTYIARNYSKPISLDFLADLSGYSKFYLIRIFKECTGMTPTQYINQIRLGQAVQMLMHTDTSVTDIAMEVGFENISYFIRLFARTYQETPLQFRKKHPIFHIGEP